MTTNKLDFIMNLTGTKISALSRAVSFDPSYISRVRSGDRAMPSSPQFIAAVAGYFARNLRTEYQQHVMQEELCPGQQLPGTQKELETLLRDWFLADPADTRDAVGDFLHGFSERATAAGAMKASPGEIIGRQQDPVVQTLQRKQSYAEEDKTDAAVYRGALNAKETVLSAVGYYYGNEGKRQGVEAFLSRLCATGRSYRLLLFSDEEMSWLYEDPAFAGRWAAYLMQLLKTGSRIVIPHYITRDSNEMFEAVQKWLPLYMTAAIEPYYYPRLRDGVYHRSLFVAQGDSALISCSVGAHVDGCLNILLDDRRAVRALEKEFEDYLALCQPLMHIRQADASAAYLASALKFERSEGTMLMAHALPSLFTMPQTVAATLQPQGTVFMDHYRRSYAAFRERMRSGDRVIEILNLPDPKEVNERGVSTPIGDFFGAPMLACTAGQLKKHLKNVCRLLRKEAAYQVVLSSRIPSNIMLHVKNRTGAQLISPAVPSIIFEITEGNMTAAFWDYLHRIVEEAGTEDQVRASTIARLEAYMAQLHES